MKNSASWQLDKHDRWEGERERIAFEKETANKEEKAFYYFVRHFFLKC